MPNLELHYLWYVCECEYCYGFIETYKTVKSLYYFCREFSCLLNKEFRLCFSGQVKKKVLAYKVNLPFYLSCFLHSLPLCIHYVKSSQTTNYCILIRTSKSQKNDHLNIYKLIGYTLTLSISHCLGEALVYSLVHPLTKMVNGQYWKQSLGIWNQQISSLIFVQQNWIRTNGKMWKTSSMRIFTYIFHTLGGVMVK